MSAEPRYEHFDSSLPLTAILVRCLDCGALLDQRDKRAHSRFHSILSGHAWSLAVLKTAHIAAHIHDNYDVVERIDSRKFDSWTNDALAEVMAELDDGEPA